MNSIQKSARLRPRLTRTWGLALSLALAGCGGGDGLPREAVSGKVAVEGAPIVRGAILFKTASNDQAAMDVGGLIRDGQYSIPKAEGPVPGTYQVMITEEPQAVKDPNDPTHTLPMKSSKLTALYRKGMNLSAVVKPGQSSPIDFDIQVGDPKSSTAAATATATGPAGRRP